MLYLLCLFILQSEHGISSFDGNWLTSGSLGVNGSLIYMMLTHSHYITLYLSASICLFVAGRIGMVKGLTCKYKQLSHHGVLISITDYDDIKVKYELSL